MGPQVKLVESPVQQLIAQSDEQHQVTDSKGRVITLKEPGVLQEYKFVELVGGEAAMNPVWMNMTMPLTYVTAIDDFRVFPPTSRLQVDALIERLGRHGIDAVTKGVLDKWGKKDAKQEVEEVKK
jgi:hypothetical protein